MKSRLALTLSALAVPFAFVTVASPASAQQRRIERPPVVRENPREDSNEADAERLRSAIVVLRKHGYGDEARRIGQILEEMSSRKKIGDVDKRKMRLENRAEKLLKAGTEQQKVRVEMLRHFGQAYEHIGWGSSSAAMNWFANSGSGGPNPMPEILQRGDGSVMDKLIDIVSQGTRVFAENDMPASARLSNRLGQFYRDREAGRRAPSGQGEGSTSGGGVSGRVIARPNSQGSGNAELQQRRLELEKRVEELRAEMERLRAELEKSKATTKGRRRR